MTTGTSPRVLVGVAGIQRFLNEEMGIEVGRTWVADKLASREIPARLIANKYHISEDRLREWAGL